MPVADSSIQVLVQTRWLASQLQTALTRRVVINRAVGIMMSRNGGSAQEGLGHLHAISQIEKRELVDVAQGIVEEAVRRSRSEEPGAGSDR